MKKLTLIILLILICSFSSGCTENIRAKKFGGSLKIELENGKKLINVTWKESNFWILTRNANVNDKPEIYEFTENSNFGIMEGKIIIKERF